MRSRNKPSCSANFLDVKCREREPKNNSNRIRSRHHCCSSSGSSRSVGGDCGNRRSSDGSRSGHR